MCQKCKFKPLACGIHSHTDMSLDGGSTVARKVKHAASLGRIADVVTDHGIMSAIAPHWTACEKHNKDNKDSKIMSIHGIEAYVIDEHRPPKVYKNGKTEPRYYHLTIHFKTADAYFYFCKLTAVMESRAIVRFGERKPLMYLKELEPIAGQITIGSGCLNSPVQQNFLLGKPELAEKMYCYLRDLAGPGNFYVEVFPHIIDREWKRPEKDRDTNMIIPGTGKFEPILEPRNWSVENPGVPAPDPDPCTGSLDIQKIPNMGVIALAKKYGDPCVISLDDHYGPEEDKVVQEARLGNGAEQWKFFGSYAAHDSETCATLLKKQLGVDDKTIEEWIDNSYQFVENFKDYKFVTFKDRWLLPTVEMIYGDKFKEKTTKEIFWELAKKHDKLPKPDHPQYAEYMERVEYELGVLADNPTADFLPYFFLIEDVCDYAKQNNILNTTRGCLTGETLVLTKDRGFCRLDSIRVGDVVYTHKGNAKKVTNTMCFDIKDEDLVKIKTDHSLGDITMTLDHKVFGVKRQRGSNAKSHIPVVNVSPEWFPASELKKGDVLYVPQIKRKILDESEFDVDLADYVSSSDTTLFVNENKIIQEIPEENGLGIRKTNKNTGLSRDLNVREVVFDRHIKFDESWAYMVGKWVGDGWCVDSPEKKYIAFAFHKEDTQEIKKTQEFFEKKGFTVGFSSSKIKKSIQMYVYNRLLPKVFKNYFPKYKNSSKTKHLGNFKYLRDPLLKEFLLGLKSAGGHSKGATENIDTTSFSLVTDIKEALMYLNVPAGVSARKKFFCRSWRIDLGFWHQNMKKLIRDDGYFVKVSNLSYTKAEKVYDITVEDDHSYLTSNYVVHNSAGGSLALYALGISITDPIKYGLPFERFITLGRIASGTLPDIDSDWRNRNEIIAYLVEKYGDSAALIATNLLMKLKTSIKDAERSILGAVRESTEKMTKMMPAAQQGQNDIEFLYGKTNKDGVKEPGFWDNKEDPAADMLRNYAENNPKIWEVVQKCIGVCKTRGVHAGGIMITPGSVQNYIPVITSKGDSKQYATAYDMKSAELVGGVKYDFLGLATLKALAIGIDSIYEHTGLKLEWGEWPHDPDVYKKVIWAGHLATVFQINTDTMRPYVIKIAPKNVEDISTICALVRPGALDAPSPDPSDPASLTAAKYFIECAQGKRQPYYIHPDLEPILKKSHGVYLLQEQVLDTFRHLADYTYEMAETVRRGIGKKIASVLEKDCGNLRKACVEKRGWTQDQADRLVDSIMASARYSFNAAHSTAYGIVGYNCAWMKYHYPLHYWRGFLTINQDDHDELAKCLEECGKMVLGVDVKCSHPEQWTIEGDKIRPPLSLLKGCGEKGVIALKAFIDRVAL